MSPSEIINGRSNEIDKQPCDLELKTLRVHLCCWLVGDYAGERSAKQRATNRSEESGIHGSSA